MDGAGSNPKASYLLGAVDETEPAAWTEAAEKNTDSWWADFVSWLAERSGDRKDAPDSAGGSGMPPIEPAPGSHVLEK
jgi:polyhydroxyalkanoate synthase